MSSKNLLVKWTVNFQTKERNTTNQGQISAFIVFIVDFEEVQTNWGGTKITIMKTFILQKNERQSHKMVKHSTIGRQQPTNCLSVFDHFVGLRLKG